MQSRGDRSSIVLKAILITDSNSVKVVGILKKGEPKRFDDPARCQEH